MPFCGLCGHAMDRVPDHENVFRCPRDGNTIQDGGGGLRNGSLPDISTWQKDVLYDLAPYAGEASFVRKIRWADGALYVATSNEGGIYRIRNNRIDSFVPMRLRRNRFQDLTCQTNGDVLVSDRDRPVVYRIQSDMTVRDMRLGNVRPRALLESHETGDVFLCENDVGYVRVSICDAEVREHGHFNPGLTGFEITELLLGSARPDAYAVYLLERGRRVVRYTISGTVSWELRDQAADRWSPVCMCRPSGGDWIAVGSVESHETARVTVFDGYANQPHASFVAQGLSLSSMTFDSHRNLYLGDGNTPRIQVLRSVENIRKTDSAVRGDLAGTENKAEN